MLRDSVDICGHPVCVCIFVRTHICGLYFKSSEAQVLQASVRKILKFQNVGFDQMHMVKLDLILYI